MPKDNDKENSVVYLGGETVFRLKSYIASRGKKFGFVKINLTKADKKEVISNFLTNMQMVGLAVEKENVQKFSTILISLGTKFKPTVYVITKKSEPEIIELWKKETGNKNFKSYDGIREFLMDIRINA